MRSISAIRCVALACVVAAALTLTACGANRSSTPTTGTASAPGGVAISGRTPPGDRVFANPRYSLALPSTVFHFANTGSTGREVHTYGLDHDFAVTAVFDPHPVSVADAVAASRAGGMIGLTHASSAVRTATLAGAKDARLVSVSGTSTKTGKATSALDLIALTPAGAMVNVEVVSVGSNAPSPAQIIDSVRLTG